MTDILGAIIVGAMYEKKQGTNYTSRDNLTTKFAADREAVDWVSETAYIGISLACSRWWAVGLGPLFLLNRTQVSSANLGHPLLWDPPENRRSFDCVWRMTTPAGTNRPPGPRVPRQTPLSNCLDCQV